MVKICAITGSKCISVDELVDCTVCEVGLFKNILEESFVMGKNAYHNNISTPQVDENMKKIRTSAPYQLISTVTKQWFRGYDEEMFKSISNLGGDARTPQH